jgi:hypothetical protein
MDDRVTSVWNRACDYDYEPTRKGDMLLKAVVQFDGLAQNGGLGHALDVAEPNEVGDALQRLRLLGLSGAAGVVERALALDDEEAQEAMSDDYFSAAAGVDTAFARYYANHADEFDPPD